MLQRLFKVIEGPDGSSNRNDAPLMSFNSGTKVSESYNFLVTSFCVQTDFRTKAIEKFQQQPQ